jgi:cardiolipin synthase
VLSTKAFAVDLAGIDDIAMLAVAALTVASAAAYLALWMRHMAG